MATRPKLYHQLIELLYTLQALGERVPLTSDTLDGGIYSRNKQGEDFMIQHAIVIVDPTLWEGLSTAGIKLLIRIQSEMKMNNVFWHFNDTHRKNVRSALAELKRRQIIFQTETTGVYIINPLKLRRGKPLSCIVASLANLSKQQGSFPDLIDMRVPKYMSIDSQTLIANGEEIPQAEIDL